MESLRSVLTKSIPMVEMYLLLNESSYTHRDTILKIHIMILFSSSYTHTIIQQGLLPDLTLAGFQVACCGEGLVCNERWQEWGDRGTASLTFSVLQPHGVISQCGVAYIQQASQFSARNTEKLGEVWGPGETKHLTYRKSIKQSSFSCITFTNDEHFHQIMILCPACHIILLYNYSHYRTRINENIDLIQNWSVSSNLIELLYWTARSGSKLAMARARLLLIFIRLQHVNTL